jgi:hypothetical protein
MENSYPRFRETRDGRTQEQTLMTIQEELQPLPMNGNAHATKTALRIARLHLERRRRGAGEQRLD